jgi:hypothetical protein
MIEDLQKQVVELTQHLAAQNMEMYHDIDGRDSESNFENPYHNPVLVREQRDLDEVFQHEEGVEDHSQCFVDWNSPLTYDTYINDEELIEVRFLSYAQEVEQKVDNHVFNKSPKREISQWGLLKVNYVDFLGIENFLSNFPKENLDVCFSMLKEILIFRGQERNENFWKTNLRRVNL